MSNGEDDGRRPMGDSLKRRGNESAIEEGSVSEDSSTPGGVPLPRGEALSEDVLLSENESASGGVLLSPRVQRSEDQSISEFQLPSRGVSVSQEELTTMDSEVVSTFLSQQREAAPEELQETYLEFEDLYDRKMWHELTEALVKFFSDPASASQHLSLFNNFILSFAEKINQLKFVVLGFKTAAQASGLNERLAFLTELAKKVDKPDSKQPYAYALLTATDVKLDLQDIEGVRQDLDKAISIVEKFDSVEADVNATYFRVQARYYQVIRDWYAFYKNSLLYLACIQVSDLDAEEARTRAYDLGVAALLSEKTYNFGELLQHPLLESLDNSEHIWLRDLLSALNKGKLESSHTLLDANLSKEPLLAENTEFLYQKISLTALTEAAFRRPPHARAMSFADIQMETGVQHDDIEILLMKAFSLEILRGEIDQVAQVAIITWVAPRILDKDQIKDMLARVKAWTNTVHGIGVRVEGYGKDLWSG